MRKDAENINRSLVAMFNRCFEQLFLDARKHELSVMAIISMDFPFWQRIHYIHDAILGSI